MNQHRVLIVDPIDETAMEHLRQRYDVTVRIGVTTGELTELIRDTDVVVLRSGVRLTGEMITGSRRLRVIARAGVGLDNVDIAAARSAGVLVFNVPRISSWAVAELTIGLLLAAARQICLADRQVRAGSAIKSALVGGELRGSSLGIVGLGHVGRCVASLAKGFGMTVLASVLRYTDARRRQLAADSIRVMDLQELLREADAVVLTVPLTSSTRRLISSEQLQTMKRSAFLINVSRSEVVDETALLRALTTGGIAGAAIDVGGTELGRTKLAGLDNVVMTPHIGGMTRQAQRRIGAVLVDSIAAALAGDPVANQVC